MAGVEARVCVGSLHKLLVSADGAGEVGRGVSSAVSLVVDTVFVLAQSVQQLVEWVVKVPAAGFEGDEELY